MRSYALAIELAAWLPEAAPALLEEAARSAGWAGDPDRAAGWIADALAQSGDAAPAERARLLERLGRYRFDARDLNAAVDAAEQAVALVPEGQPSALRARVLAALATGRMLLGDFGGALPVAERAVAEAQQAGAVAEQAHGLATLGIVLAHGGKFDAGIAALRTSFSLARRTGNVEDIVRAAADHVYLLYTAGRFTEALEVAKEGRAVAESLDAPPAMTWTLDNNIAASFIATGRWAEAGRFLDKVIGESSGKATHYLELLQLELAVGQGDSQRTAHLAAALAKAPPDPGLAGPLRACLAEQALYAGNLAAAAGEVLDGLAILAGTGWAEEEIRLLAAGAWVAAEIAARPAADRPGNLPETWEGAAVLFPGRARAITDAEGRGQPAIAAFGALAAAEHARQHRSDDPATWRGVADAWRGAGQPYREAYARLREAQAAARAGQRDEAARAMAAGEGLARKLPSGPLLSLAEEVAGGRG